MRARPRTSRLAHAAVLAAALLAAACARGPWERACPDGAGCDDDEACERRVGAPEYKVTHSICAERCDDDDACPPPPAGDAAPRCQAHGACRLACGPGTACPAGTVCADGSCMFPAPR